MWPTSKAEGYHWSWKISADLIILCIPMHGNYVSYRIPDSHRWKRLGRFSGLTHFPDQKTRAREGKWLVQGHPIRKGRAAAWVGLFKLCSVSFSTSLHPITSPIQLLHPLGMAALGGVPSPPCQPNSNIKELGSNIHLAAGDIAQPASGSFQLTLGFRSDKGKDLGWAGVGR